MLLNYRIIMNQDASNDKMQEMQQIPLYKRTYVVMGYAIPYWVLFIVVVILLYVIYTKFYKPTQVVSLNMSSNELAPASAAETPTVVKDIVR
jgi:hypothetical protein